MMIKKDDIGQKTTAPDSQDMPSQSEAETKTVPEQAPRERGGPKGPEPTRFGDWESGGRCTDF